MAILARLILVIQWIVFLWFSIMIGWYIYWTYNGDDFKEFSPELEYFAWSYILIPFIRYIIFGRFGWFPWTPIRKE